MNEERNRRPDNHRLFYALWPGTALRRALADATGEALSGVTGNRVPASNLHVTLAFLGAVPGRALAGLIAVGGRGPWPLVELDFARVEYWPRPRVLVAVPAVVPLTGAEIADRLWSALEPKGFTREKRRWTAHLTLMRKLSRPPPRDFAPAIPRRPERDAADWRLALVESETLPEGPRYRPLADWPLGH